MTASSADFGFASGFQMTDTKNKKIKKTVNLTGHKWRKQRNEPIRIQGMKYNFLKARQKSRIQGVLGFGFASHWLKNWREIFKPITKRSNCVINFDSRLKTALTDAN